LTLPKQYLLSDFLKHHVKCDSGLDHGPGLSAWMHPPVHRLLGWSSRPSSLKLTRTVWKLNQLKGIGSDFLYVKGESSTTDQTTLDRLPTLLFSDTLNLNGDKIGSLVDFIFEPKTGQIIQYMISRSDPRLPGTSRWLLPIDRIADQQPGMVSVRVTSLEELPLARASLRQDLLRRSRNWRDQIQEITEQASGRLEGWLEESPWEDKTYRPSRINFDVDPLENWSDQSNQSQPINHLDSSHQIKYSDIESENSTDDDDPWI